MNLQLGEIVENLDFLGEKSFNVWVISSSNKIYIAL